MVHGNLDLALLACLGIFQFHAAAEILRDVRAGIIRVRCLEQRQRKRMADPRRAHDEREFLAVDLDRLWRDHLAGDGMRHVRAELLRVTVLHRLDHCFVARPVGNHPVAERAVRANQFDDCRRNIFFVRRLHFGLLDEIEIQRHAVARDRRRVFHHRRAEIQIGIFPECFYVDGERQAVNLQLAALLQCFCRDGGFFIAVSENEFVVRRAFGIILGFALGKVHLHFAREHVRRELADEQQDDARMRKLDADFFGRQLKTIDVRRDKVHQQHHADKIAAGKKEGEISAEQMRADDDPLPEIMRLRRVKPVVHLRQRADEHHHDGARQQHAGELERRENRGKFFNEHRDIWRTG